MKTHCVRLAIVLTAAFAPGVVMAQHEAHQPGAPQASAGTAPCAQVQPAVDNIIAAAMARLESARLSNSAAEMRAAVDHVESALRDIRTQLSRCTAAAAAADAQPGHTMPGLQQPPGASAPAAPMDHSRMPMGGTPTTKPGAGTGTTPATPMPPMDYSKMPMGGTPTTKPRS